MTSLASVVAPAGRIWLSKVWRPILCLVAIGATAGAVTTIRFNERADTELRASPNALAVLDATRAEIIVGDAKGVQLMRAADDGYQPFGGQGSDAPVDDLATADLGGRRFIAYSVRGERAIRIVPVTERGTIGTGPLVPIPGRTRAIAPIGQRGFVVVHSEGVDLVEPAAAGAFRRNRVSGVGSAVDVAVADLDVDQIADLVLADEPLGELVVLRGQPDGSMQQLAALRTQRAPRRVIAANIDGDPALEIVVLGDLGLSAHDNVATGLGPERAVLEEPHLADVAAADLDGDRIDDIIFTNRSRTIVSSLLGRSAGGFADGPSFLTGGGPGALLVLSTSGRRPDIVVANTIANSLTRLHYDQHGIAGVAALAASIGPLSGAAAADFDGDGHLDLALAGDDTGRVEVRLGQGNGHFAATPSFPIGMTPRAMVAGDWDGDGKSDLAIADFGSDRIAVLQGNGKGGFAVPSLLQVGAGPTALLHGDFGGPAGNDLVVANQLADSVSVLHGDGRGNFSAGPVFEVGPRPSFLFVGDVDGDGADDLVTGNRQYETITIVPRKGRGFGEPYNKVLADTPRPSTARDLDGDGLPELVVTDGAASTVQILKGQKGVFEPLKTIRVGRSPSSVELGDFDADGQADLAVLHKDTGIVAILLRLGG